MPTEFTEVYEMFLSKITDYDILKLDEDELNQEFKMLLKKALARFVYIKDVSVDYDFEQFSRELTELEIDIISSYMVSAWISPKINSITLLRQSLSSKDFSMYSQANHLKELMELKDSTEKDAQYWASRYSLIDFAKNGGK